MTLDLLIDGRLALWADGQMDLPRQPPFAAIGPPGPAAVLIVDLLPESPRCIKLFDAWYRSCGSLHVVVGDGRATWIVASMRCVGMVLHRGIQQTVEKPGPIKRRFDERSGLVLPYRDQPIFQAIAKDVYRYTLAADRYEFTVRPERPVVAKAMVLN